MGASSYVSCGRQESDECAVFECTDSWVFVNVVFSAECQVVMVSIAEDSHEGHVGESVVFFSCYEMQFLLIGIWASSLWRRKFLSFQSSASKRKRLTRVFRKS